MKLQVPLLTIFVGSSSVSDCRSLTVSGKCLELKIDHPKADCGEDPQLVGT